MSDSDPRLPAQAPSPDVWDSLVRWRALDEAALERARKSAQTWRNGLAGFVTLLLSVLVLKGSDLAETPDPYRWIAIVGCIGGTTLAIAGLWFALGAEAPAESEVDLSVLLATYRSVARYEQSIARRAQERLVWARRLVIAALAALIIGIAAWWSAPAATPATTAVQVEWLQGGETQQVCGMLLPTGDRQILVRPNGSTDPVVIPMRQVVSVTQVGSCG